MNKLPITFLPPLENFNFITDVNQHFAQSRQTYAADFSDMEYGHNGMDFGRIDNKLGYGTKILASHDADSITIETDFPTKKKGTGIYLRKKLPSPFMVNGVAAWYIETAYWHLADVQITGAATVKAGDVIGLMGNTGYVFPRPSQQNPYNGTHLHWGVRFYDQFGNMIDSQFGGDYVNPLPFIWNGEKLGARVYLRTDMHIGSYGDEVSILQILLRLEGLLDAEEIGSFGPKTLAAVVALQSKYAINPAIGYVGPRTRLFLNSKYV